MADVTYYVAMPFLQDDTGLPTAGAAEECQSSTTGLRRAEILSPANSGTPGCCRNSETSRTISAGSESMIRKSMPSGCEPMGG